MRARCLAPRGNARSRREIKGKGRKTGRRLQAAPDGKPFFFKKKHKGRLTRQKNRAALDGGAAWRCRRAKKGQDPKFGVSDGGSSSSSPLKKKKNRVKIKKPLRWSEKKQYKNGN